MIYRDFDKYYTSLRDLVEPNSTEKKTRHCLGKRFASNIRSKDQFYINSLRAKTEEIKLAIIDAAEKGERPPILNHCEWLFDLYYNKKEYKFIYLELEDWFLLNGLEGTFSGYRTDANGIRLTISLSKSISIGEAKPPEDTSHMLTRALRKKSDPYGSGYEDIA